MVLNASRRPVVGLTTYLEPVRAGIWDVPAGYLPADYFQGVIMAGGVAMLLPPQPTDAAAVSGALDSLDALVITGGYDLDPAAYGQQPHPTTDQPRTARDAWELALLRGALDGGLDRSPDRGGEISREVLPRRSGAGYAGLLFRLHRL